MPIRLLAIACFAIAISTADCQQKPRKVRSPTSSKHYVQKQFVGEDKAELTYFLMTPKAYDADKQYPLVLALHGRGGGTMAATVLGRDAMRDQYPCFVMAPKSPRSAPWAWPKKLPRRDRRPDVLPRVLPAVDALLREWSIDPTRIYVTGESLGGIGTFGAVAARPDLFAAAAPICGGWDPEEAKKMLDVPFWIFHGAQDRTVPVKHSRAMNHSLRQAGAKPKYTEYPDVGHNCWRHAYADAELWQWLFDQRKRAAKKLPAKK